MLAFFTVVHVLLCVFMIFVILLQPGKDAGMGAALGGGAATSAFGGRGAVTFLTKVTAACAGLYFLTSLGLSFVGLKTSVVGEDMGAKKAATAPANAGTATPASSAAAPKDVNPPGGGTPIPATGVTQPQPTPPTSTASPAPTPAAQTAPAAPSGVPGPAEHK